MQTENNLSKYLSPLNAWALSFGCAVGWGAFVMPGTTILPIAGPEGTAIGLFFGALAMLVIGANYHSMMNCYGDAGGTFTYTKKFFGNDHGFLSAWFLVLTYVAIIWANSTALALIGRRLLGDFFQFGFHYQIVGYDVYFGEVMLSGIALIVFGLICMYSRNLAGTLQTIMAIILLLGIIICFANVFDKLSIENLEPLFIPEKSEAEQIFNIIALAPWAFIGFESISNSTEEFKFSPKKSFLIMAVALISGFLSYALLAMIAVSSIPTGYGKWTTYLADLGNLEGLKSFPSFYSVNEVMGSVGIQILGVTIVAAIITGIIGNYISASRLIYTMSKDKVMPEWFSKLNKNHAPQNTILAIMLTSMIMPFFGMTAISWIIDVLSVGAVIAYGYTSAAAYSKACDDDNLTIQITGITGLLLSVLFGLFLLVPNLLSIKTMEAESYLILVLWSILGFAFFRNLFSRHDEERKYGKSVIVHIVMLFLIFFGSLMWVRQSSNEVMENAILEVRHFYDDILEIKEVKRHRYHQAIDDIYINRILEKIRSSIFTFSVIQMALILISLGLMFNIFSIMRNRENQAEIEKVQAEENNKAKTMFLSNMSHDIRTPMNAIIGYVNLAQREGVTMEQTQDFLKKIEASSQHLLSLINDVLEMSRIESGKMELDNVKTNLVKLLDEVHDMFATQMESKKIKFKVKAENIRDKWVLCDKNRLNRVLLNLISNAYKFTPENGKISITLNQLVDSDEFYGNYELRVKDSGIGMSPEFAARVFEAFEREKTSTVSGIQGTGLGMAITKSIIDLMGGNIRVETEQGKGTEFIVNVKYELTDAEEETKVEEVTEVKTESTRPKKLLLVEDIEVNREIATMILTQAGFEVETATNGKEAVEKVSKMKAGEYDAVLMDIQMPVMNGYEAARAIRALEDEKQSQVPIIAMTANAFKEDIDAANEAGMNAHISKPIDIGKMMETLNEVLK